MCDKRIGSVIAVWLGLTLAAGLLAAGAEEPALARYREIAAGALGTLRPAVPDPVSRPVTDAYQKHLRAQRTAKPGCFVIDDAALQQQFDATQLRAEGYVPLHLDVGRGVWVAHSWLSASDCPPSLCLFQIGFLEFQKHLHPGFRQARVPFGDGLAALGALTLFYRTDLALLPQFVEETAAVAVLVEADPTLISAALGGAAPADLQPRIAAALGKVWGGGEPAEVERAVGSLLGAALPTPAGQGSAVSGSRFSLADCLPGAEAARIATVKTALRLGAPGLRAEWVRAAAELMADRGLGVEATTVGGTLLDAWVAELARRGVSTNATAGAPPSRDARFDPSTFKSLFGLAWLSDPQAHAWRTNAILSLGRATPDTRRAEQERLEQALRELLNGPSPVGACNAWLAQGPTASDARQPRISLRFEEAVEPKPDGAEVTRYDPTLEMRWQVARPFGRTRHLEEIVWRGHDVVAGAAKPAPLQEQPAKVSEGTAVAGDRTPAPREGRGPEPGVLQGNQGTGPGRGPGRGGEGERPQAQPPPAVAGIAPGSRLIPFGDDGPQAADLAIGQYAEVAAKQGAPSVATVPPGGLKPGAMVGAPMVRLESAVGAVVRIETEAGELIAGVAQQVLRRKRTERRTFEWVAAERLTREDVLWGPKGEVPIRQVEKLPEAQPVLIPTMSTYLHVFASGVLVNASKVIESGGFEPGTEIEVPTGTRTAAEFQGGDPIRAFEPPRPEPLVSAVRSASRIAFTNLVELRYQIDGRSRRLRVGPGQLVLVRLPDPAEPGGHVVTPAVAVPPREPLKSDEDRVELDPGAAPVRPKAEGDPVVLQPGMDLVVELGKQSRTVKLESLSAVAVPRPATAEEAQERGAVNLVVWNLKIVRAEGLLCQVEAAYENITGFHDDTFIVLPKVGTAPGTPANRWGPGDRLPVMALGSFNDGGGNEFLATRAPELTWLTDRTRRRESHWARRYVRLSTEYGHELIAGNLQRFLAYPVTGQRVSDLQIIPAEELVHRRTEWRLLYLDPNKPRPDGTLIPVEVKQAEFVFAADRGVYRQLVGSGLGGSRTNQQGRVERMDYYLANGYLALSSYVDDQGAGGGGGGGGGAQAGPDPGRGVAIAKSSLITGLQTDGSPDAQRRIRFSEEEQAAFGENLKRLEAAFAQVRWGKVQDEARLLRFLALYFRPGAGRQFTTEERALLLARYAREGDWAVNAYRFYGGARAALLQHGSPRDLYHLAYHYVFLITLFYETGNAAAADALRDDFLCFSLRIALGNPAFPGREQYYQDDQYLLSHALLWTRDVMGFIRDGSTEPHVVVRVQPAGWDQILRSAGGLRLEELQAADGGVDLERLWIQLFRRLKQSADPAGSRKDFSYVLITAPDQDPQHLFADGDFLDDPTLGPFVGQNLRGLLGITPTTVPRPAAPAESSESAPGPATPAPARPPARGDVEAHHRVPEPEGDHVAGGCFRRLTAGGPQSA